MLVDFCYIYATYVATLSVCQSDAGPVPAVQNRRAQHQARPHQTLSPGGGVAGGCGGHPHLAPRHQTSPPAGDRREGPDDVEAPARPEVEVAL